MRLLTLLTILACAAPASASAAWRLDPSFAGHGRFERSGDAWQDPQGALADGGGGTIVWTPLRLQRITPGGRADAGYGDGGGVLLDPDLWHPPHVTPWGRGRTLVFERGRTPPPPGVPQGTVRLLDRHGDVRPGSDALTAALRDGDRRGLSHWLVPWGGDRVLDLARSTTSSAFTVRTLRSAGGAGPRHRVTWPSSVATRIMPPAAPVVSGGRLVVETQGGTGLAPRVLIGLTPAGRVDRTWGRRGLTRLRTGASRLFPWRGGIIAVGLRGVTWIDRHGRVTGRRSLRIDAADVDGAGRVVVARTADDARHVSVLRLDARHRVDPAFGRLALRATGRSRPVAVVAQAGGRVVVVGERVAYVEPDAYDREDFPSLAGRGTVAWRLRGAR
jgi:hypothetical protein